MLAVVFLFSVGCKKTPKGNSYLPKSKGGIVGKSNLLANNNSGKIETAKRGTRPVWIGGGWVEADIYQRLVLPIDAVIVGPAILEQTDATIFLDPGFEGRVDNFGNLIISRNDQS